MTRALSPWVKQADICGPETLASQDGQADSSGWVPKTPALSTTLGEPTAWFQIVTPWSPEVLALVPATQNPALSSPQLRAHSHQGAPKHRSAASAPHQVPCPSGLRKDQLPSNL
jgi:hypothetical protein